MRSPMIWICKRAKSAARINLSWGGLSWCTSFKARRLNESSLAPLSLRVLNENGECTMEERRVRRRFNNPEGGQVVALPSCATYSTLAPPHVGSVVRHRTGHCQYVNLLHGQLG